MNQKSAHYHKQAAVWGRKAAQATTRGERNRFRKMEAIAFSLAAEADDCERSRRGAAMPRRTIAARNADRE
jgi:hypothetical protein